MNKKILIESIFAVALLTLVSYSNVVGYNTVKISQEGLLDSDSDFEYCKDYLFETLIDISNNQNIINLIKSNHDLFTTYNSRFLIPHRNNLDLNVEHLELLYNLGFKIIDRLSKDKVERMMENIEIEKPEYLDELDAIIMDNDELRERIYTLNNMNREFETLNDDFPIICDILTALEVPLIEFIIKFQSILFHFEENNRYILFILSGIIYTPFAIICFISFLFYYLYCCEPYNPW